MEALVTVSLAGNILQFLNFTRDTISKSRQIHTSISGTLKEYADLEYLTTDLRGLSDRLQASAVPLDPVLEQLCSRCREVADELLKALESLCVKGNHTRFQSLRKALKVLWGKEKLSILEERLAGFRQEFTLHITVELSSRFDVLEFQQMQSFQALDHATKEGVQKIVNLVEQSRTTHTLIAKEQERSRTEVLSAIADAASGYHEARSTEAENISARIDKANENTQAQLTETLRNQEVMMQQLGGLQLGLRQLQLEIDRKTEELKGIVVKINTTHEGPKRKLLKEMGNSATVVLMSLHELYKALQEMMKPLVHQARIAFGTLFWQQDDRSGIVEDTFEFELNSPRTGFSLPLYYSYYYQPLFRNLQRQRLASEVFSSTKMNLWIHRMHLSLSDPCEPSPEAHAVSDLAMNRNELVWTMATLVAGLNACLTPEEAMLVLSTAFSLCYDPKCVLPMDRTWIDTDLPSRVNLFFNSGSAKVLQRPRYGLDCTLGRRLREDYVLLSRLADKCGLQEEVSRKVNLGCEASTGPERADLTLTLVALASQPSSWQVLKMKRGPSASPFQRILFHDSSLWVGPSASLVVDFLYAIQSAGILITFGAFLSQPSCNRDISKWNDSNRKRWLRSKEYNHILKTYSWWPSSAAYMDWRNSLYVLKEGRRRPAGAANNRS